ncbi:hypothetical protein OSTOST_01246 [Ostertagia ostertagi]
MSEHWQVDSLEGSKKGGQSGSSSISNSNDKMACVKPDDEKRKAMMEKKGSASELLVKMRSRFQHRATEPVFHTLATKAPEVRYVVCVELKKSDAKENLR